MPLSTAGLLMAGLSCLFNGIHDGVRKSMALQAPDPGLVLTARSVGLIPILIYAWASAGTLALSSITHPLKFWALVFTNASMNALASILYYEGLMRSPLSATIPFLSLTPGVSLVFAWVFLKQRPTVMSAIGVATVCLGGILLARVGPEKVSGLHASKHVEDGAGDAVDGGRTVISIPRKDSKPMPEEPVIIETESMIPGYPWGGSSLFVFIALLWAVTATMDASISAHGPATLYTLAVHVVMSILMLAVAFLTHKGATCKKLGHLMLAKGMLPMLLGSCILGFLSHWLYIRCLDTLLLSYALAIKRSSMIISSIIGRVMFQDGRFWLRMFHCLIMLTGVFLIVFGAV